MSDFMRSIKITDLTNKANNWSAAEIEKFHGNKIPANRAIVCYKEGSGYVNASLTGAEYIEISTGAAYSVRHTVDENSWNCFSALHTKSTELNTFRIETPTYRSVTGTKEYREISSPNGEFGSSVLTKLNENELTTGADIIEFAEKYISDVSIVLAQMKAVATENNCGITLQVFNPANYYIDSVGVYFTNLDTDWTYSLNTAVTTGLQYFVAALTVAVLSTNLTNDQKNTLVLNARELWT